MRLSIFFLGIWLAVAGCSERIDPAQNVYDQAKKLENEGKFLAAYLFYDSLAFFPKSKIYAQAKAELEQRGLSIGACLSSWTVKEMVACENKCKQYYERHHQAAPEGYFGPYYDGWGHEIQIDWFPEEKIVFIIKSAGPDEKTDTADDIFLGYREQYEFEELEAREEGQKRRSTRLRAVAKGERIVDLGDLSDFNGVSISEQLKTLDSLQQSKQIRFNEKVVDLNDLVKQD